MPNFLIIGVARGGTTSLYKYLTAHPCVAPAVQNEVHFFDVNFGKGMDWYLNHFPSLFDKYSFYRTARRSLVTGESSPYYIFHPLVPKRVSTLMPRVKLIALLRNPIDRAYSHYDMIVRQGLEALSFEEAIWKERERLAGERERLLADPSYLSANHRAFSYLSRGIYVDQIRSWLEVFPQEQMLILKSEDLFAAPSPTFRRTLQFLGLPGWEPSEYAPYNRGSYTGMAAATRKQLRDYFKPHNQALYEYLGQDLGWDH